MSNDSLEDIRAAIDLAKQQGSSGATDAVKCALLVLYQQQSKIKEAKKQDKESTRGELEALDKELKDLISTYLDQLATGPPELDPKSIKFSSGTKSKDLLGEGSFGKVYRATLSGKKVAVKIPNSRVTNMEEFIREVNIMRRVFHPNIVMLMGACTRMGDKVIIVSELMHQDLEAFLKSPDYDKTTVSQRVKLGKDVALGLNWLHSVGIVHRDLKLGNILLDEHLNAKIADFGFSQIKKSAGDMIRDKVKPKGNVLYMAPEVMQMKQFNEKADIYSYGLIFWEILTAELWDPPSKYATADTYKKFICELHKRPEILDDIPEQLVPLLNKCWHKDAERRPEFTRVVADLNAFLVDSSLDNPYARRFWKKYFMNTDTAEYDEKIEWSYFSRLLRSKLGVTRETLQGLRAIMCWQWENKEPQKNKANCITIERVNLTTNLFGPFFRKENISVLREMNKWYRKKWFHGDIGYDTAHARLLYRDSGFYLIRLSSRRPGFPFTVTYMTEKNGVPKIENARMSLQKVSLNSCFFLKKLYPFVSTCQVLTEPTIGRRKWRIFLHHKKA
mmetsp:Transcript_28888/g.32092  ORF Transcript_28888/g.32092 Transcript_28888/m.32092 type:complete len:560 (+) Transcript_28888:25-1704(+)